MRPSTTTNERLSMTNVRRRRTFVEGLNFLFLYFLFIYCTVPQKGQLEVWDRQLASLDGGRAAPLPSWQQVHALLHEEGRCMGGGALSGKKKKLFYVF